MKFRYLIFLSLLGLFLNSCESILELNPEDATVVLEGDALKTKSDLQELLNSSYDALNGIYGGRSQRTAELLADNVVLKDGLTDEMVNIFNRYTTGYFTDNESYAEGYRSIMRANIVIENVNNVSGMTDADKTRMVAEAKFIRGICHFAIVRLFGQPYGYKSDNSQLGIVIKTNSTVELLARSTVKQVYDQILTDLIDAEAVLPTQNSNGVYATKWAAKAALANVYFQMHDYDNAYKFSNDVIENGGFVFDDVIGRRFLATTAVELSYSWATYSNVEPTQEAIFKLVSTVATGKKVGGDFGVYRSDGTNNPNVRINPTVYKKEIASNSGDRRIEAWYRIVNPGATNEFVSCTKFNSEYINIPVFYLTEQILIRAEAVLLKSSSDLNVAISDINKIRERAYGSSAKNLLSTATADAALIAVHQERRLELIAEGNRLHDLKRIGSGTEPNTLIRGLPWDYVGLVIQFDVNEANELFVANPEPN